LCSEPSQTLSGHDWQGFFFGPLTNPCHKRAAKSLATTFCHIYSLNVLISVVIITRNEEANIARTLNSVRSLVQDGRGEVIMVDAGSTDRTREIANSLGAKVYCESWKGYAAQKNSAIEKAQGEWILSLDGDEELEPSLADEIQRALRGEYSGAPKDSLEV